MLTDPEDHAYARSLDWRQCFAITKIITLSNIEIVDILRISNVNVVYYRKGTCKIQVPLLFQTRFEASVVLTILILLSVDQNVSTILTSFASSGRVEDYR